MSRYQNLPAGDATLEKRLKLSSIRGLEFLLGASHEHLALVANRAGAYYQPFPKRDKVRPFQKTPTKAKDRIIDNPVDPLKAIQRKIKERLLEGIDLPYYICGGITGRSVLDNVLIHLGAKVLVRIDIKNFFPTISNIQIYRVWNLLLGCSPAISELLTRLTTFERHLPQGAPTSMLLANLVLYSVYHPIQESCETRSVKYSTWVDDLAFSGDDASKVIGTVVQVLSASGLGVSHRKLAVMGPRDQKLLNGLLLGVRPSLTKERLGQLRSGIYKLRSHQIAGPELARYLRALQGRISFVESVAPTKGGLIRREFEAAKKAALGL